MENKNVVLLSLVLGIVFCITCWFGMNLMYNNRITMLENRAKAQQEVNKTVYDTVWKVVKQKAQISDKYEQQFKNVYSNIMQERHYDKGGDMWKFVKEHNPQFDTSLLISLGNTIEGQRIRFENSQKMLIDIKREHDNLRTLAPSSWFVGNKPELKIDIVTSSKTKEIFSTGEENDVDLFERVK